MALCRLDSFAGSRCEKVFIWRSGNASVNSFVVSGLEGTLAIDPAADLTPEAVDFVGLPPVDTILLTHVQEEHVAGCANFSGIPVFAPEGDAYLCEGREAYARLPMKWEAPWDWTGRGNFKGHISGAPNERPPEVPIKLAGFLRDGDAIKFLHVVATPGHGKHAVSLTLKTSAGLCAFCGDLVYGADGRMWSWADCEWDYGLQGGQRALRDSANRLRQLDMRLLLPSHGEPIRDADEALAALSSKLSLVIDSLAAKEPASPVNFPDIDSPASGFRQISPHLHQWRNGNLAVVLSDSGEALFIDDGLCNWLPLPERSELHRRTVETMKKALGVKKVSLVIPTHYHGDHTENIPALRELEGTELVALDVVSAPMERPERFRLSCLLPFYDTGVDAIKADKVVPDGAKLRWNEYEIELFHLGGQTFHHAGIAMTVDGRKVVFAGDSCFTNVEGCEVTICHNDAEPFSRGYAYAVERLIERNPDIIVCGHGVAMKGPQGHLLGKREAWRVMGKAYEALSARGSLAEFFTPL